MKNCSIDEVVVGSVLAADLKTSEGSLILGQGAMLSESLIARLQKMNVKILPIEGEDSEEEQKEREALLLGLDARFEGTENDPILQEVKKIVQEHIESI